MFPKVLESALPMNQSHDALRGHLRTSLKAAHGVTDNWSEKGPWIMDVFPSHVVYQFDGGTHKRSYTATQGSAGTDPAVTLGKPSPVHMAYADSKEAEVSLLMEIPGVYHTSETGQELVMEGVEIEVKEGSTSALPKPIQVKLIQPGWGSMAYYSEAIIKRDGPKVFKKGTHMMWNHATESEEVERPEGNLDNLAAVLTKDAYWLDAGPKGPGLYSEAKVFSDYATQVAEKGPHIGVSINAYIKGHEGEAEGKTGKIADQFIHAFSTDFVTKPGAGGAPIVPVQESQRAPLGKETESMTDAEIKALLDRNTLLETQAKESQSKLAEMEQHQNQVLAAATVGATLREAGIQFSQKALELACQNPKVKEGKLDDEWLKSIASAFSDGQTGKVTGHGRIKEGDDDKDEAVQTKEAEDIWKALGVPEAGLKVAMGVR